MRVPTKQQLVAAFRDLTPAHAQLIRQIGHAADDEEDLKKLLHHLGSIGTLPKTAKYISPLHSRLWSSQIWRITFALHAMNEIMDTYGVEGLGPPRSGDYAPPYEYLNTGETYDTTLIYRRSDNSLNIGSWGDVAERHPDWP